MDGIIKTSKTRIGLVDKMLKKSNIAYENGDFWVMQLKGVFQVMISGITHSSTDSSYSDFSIAKARCDYLAKHRK